MNPAGPRWIPADPALPGLAEFFGPAGARSVAAEMVREAADSSVDADSGELRYVKYKPTKHCIVQWAFPASSGDPFMVSAKLFSGIQGAAVISQPKFQSLAKSIRSRANGRTEPYRYLHHRQILFQLFPLDAKLPGLPFATSGAWAAAAFARALDVRSTTIRITEITPVAYNPWNRCVFRYTVEESSSRRQYFAKLFRDDRGQTMAATLTAVSELLGASGGSWRIPAPLAFIPEARMLVLEALEKAVGARSLLKQAVEDPVARRRARDVFARTAETLLEFQQAVIQGLPAITPQALLRYYQRKIDRVSQIAPELTDTIGTQLARLETEASELPTEPMVLSHGAFRHTHLLLCGDKLGLVDLDNLRLSGVSADPGDFLAYLDRTALRRPALRPIIEELEAAFVAGLRRRRSIDMRWVAWHRSAAHVKWALRSFHSLSLKGRLCAEDLAALGLGI